MDLPPEDDMSTVPHPSSPKKSLGEVFLEKGLAPPTPMPEEDLESGNLH